MQKQQAEALLRRHDRELNEVDRHYRALDRLEARENRAAANAELREGCRQLRARSFALKPEFDRALAGDRKTDDSGSTGGGAARWFNRVAGAVGLTKGDLEAAFARATAGKVKPTESGDAVVRTPEDAEKLERARQLAEEFDRRSPARQDRERER